MKSKEFRNSSLFLRNEFESCGTYGFPIIKRQIIDLSNLELIACSDTSTHDIANLYKGVHFFVDDYRFNSIYNHPEKSLKKYSKYRFLLTPDFSLYADMKPWRQIESVGKSRWIGAFWQHQGLTVFPTIIWSKPMSYRYCFDSIEKHSIVAISVIGCKHERVAFMRGYNVMLETIEPDVVICLGMPFPEMKGNIIPIDYRSSRKAVRDGR